MTRLFLAFALACLSGVSSAADVPAPLGTRAPDFTLPDPVANKPWATADVPKDAKAVVVAFVCTGCPVSNAYLPRLAALHKQFAPDGVAFVAVNSHPADTAADVAVHAKQYPLPFPTLKDADGKIAARLNVDRVPAVVVLDAGRMVRYAGRIDDQFAPGVHRGNATTHELRNAIDAVVEGRAVTTPAVPAAGCRLGHDAPVVPAAVTYHKEVARVIQAKCQECHRPGEAAPFALMTYPQAKGWAGMIREVVADGVMPPWHADAPRGHFANDRRLSDADKQTLIAWVDAGCPEGNPADAPPAKTYASGWRLGREPDVVVKMAKPVSVPAQFLMGAIGMPYQYVKGDKAFAEDTWVEGVEVRPDLRGVTHHIIVYTVPAGTRLRDLAKDDGFARHMLAAFVPGDAPHLFPKGMAKKIPKGASLIFEVHYTPNGTAGVDTSSVGLLVAKAPPKYEIKTDTSLNGRLSIPPGAANHSVAGSRLEYDRPVTLLSFTPHMHVRGKAFWFDLVTADGTRTNLLRVPKYDFNWQVAYELAEPVVMPAGAHIECVAWYDNSAANPTNPDPTKTVRWGQQTWEEMMLGFVEYYVER